MSDQDSGGALEGQALFDGYSSSPSGETHLLSFRR